ncbi:NIPSNAP family protein [Roseibium sp.]|uniref:NIPSNAP family protein n=1 Tax=Roseibium sp. TaxID=1936156 RepID=UPI003A96F978
MMPSGTVYELRRYRLQCGKRETLIELFEREFIETQELTGMSVHGIYRDADDPDAFVWFRSFPDMEHRARALAAFYGGPVWARWGADANATMLNSDNVLLLQSVGKAVDFGRSAASGGVVTISTCALAPGTAASFAKEWQKAVAPELLRSGARIDAAFVTEARANTFPRLPVREGETVFVWVSAFENEAECANHERLLAVSATWQDQAFPWLDRQIWRPLERVYLSPTSRSRHGW